MKKLRELIWGRIYQWGFRPLYALEHTEPVFRFVNASARRHFAREGTSELSPVQERVLEDVERVGIAVTTLAEFFGQGEEALAGLREFQKKQTGRTNHIKPFITEYFEKIPEITLTNPFARLALDEHVLTLAGRYLSMSPKLQEFTLSEIRALPEGSPKVGSMRWHRDPHDRRLLKMFIYLTDVDSKTGPFRYVTYSTAGKKYGNLFPQQPPAGFYAPSDEVEKRVDPADIFSAEGRAGTVVFADTSGLHGGGYVHKGSRIMSTAGYLPPKSFLMRHLTAGETDELSPLQSYALTGDETLPSRGIFRAMKRALLGKESFGDYGSYM